MRQAVRSGLTTWIVWLASAGVVQAGSINFNHTFKVENANMWTGALNNSTISYNKFFGTEWNTSGGFGSVASTVVGDFGLEVKGATSGKIGVELQMKATSGAINATLPVSLNLSLPDQIRPGQVLKVGSTWSMDTNGLGFNTHSPDLGFRAGLVLGFHAEASAKACLFACAEMPTTTLLHIPEQNVTMLALNLDETGNFPKPGDPQVVILNQDVTGIVKSTLGKEIGLAPNRFGQPMIGLTYKGAENSNSLLPVIATDSLVNGGLKTTGDVAILGLKADITQIAAQFIPNMPPLAASLDQLVQQKGQQNPAWKVIPAEYADIAGAIDYNLLTVKAGVELGARQEFSMTAPTELMLDLELVETGEHISLPAGTTGSFYIPTSATGQSLTLKPTLFLAPPNFTNTTSLKIEPTLDISAFGLGLGDLQIGPLLDYSHKFETPPIPIYSKSFQLGGPMSTTMGNMGIGLDTSILTSTFPGGILDGTHFNEIINLTGNAYAQYWGPNTWDLVLENTTINTGNFNFSTYQGRVYMKNSIINGNVYVGSYGALQVRDGFSQILNGTIGDVGAIRVADGGHLALINVDAAHRFVVEPLGILTTEKVPYLYQVALQGTLNVNDRVRIQQILGLGGTVNVNPNSFLSAGLECNVGCSGVSATVNVGQGAALEPWKFQNANITLNGGELKLMQYSELQGVNLGGTGKVTQAFVDSTSIPSIRDSWLSINGGADTAYEIGSPLTVSKSKLDALGGNMVVTSTGRLTLDTTNVSVTGAILNRGTLEFTGESSITPNLIGNFEALRNAPGAPGESPVITLNLGSLQVLGLVVNEEGSFFEIVNGSTLDVALFLDSTPTVLLRGGTMRIAHSVVVAQGGGLRIDRGTLELWDGSKIQAPLVNNVAGEVKAEGRPTRIEGNYRQGPDASLAEFFDLQDLGFDESRGAMRITGEADLAGELDITFFNGSIIPQNGFSFTALLYGSYKGAFDVYSLPLFEGFLWRPDYQLDRLLMRLVASPAIDKGTQPTTGELLEALPESQAPTSTRSLVGPLPDTAVPEPSTFLLVGATFAGLILARRRRAKL